MIDVKKTIFFIFISIYSALILFLGSESYLIGGSNVLEFVYSLAIPVKIAIIFGLFSFGYISIFTKKYRAFARVTFTLVIFFSFVSSQSVVYSGKNNSIEYYIYGFFVKKINIDPTEGGNMVVNSIAPGFVRVSNGDMSFTYVSLFCPLCLDVSEIQKF